MHNQIATGIESRHCSLTCVNFNYFFQPSATLWLTKMVNIWSHLTLSHYKFQNHVLSLCCLYVSFVCMYQLTIFLHQFHYTVHYHFIEDVWCCPCCWWFPIQPNKYRLSMTNGKTVINLQWFTNLIRQSARLLPSITTPKDHFVPYAQAT
jgi:hypothetical protein